MFQLVFGIFFLAVFKLSSCLLPYLYFGAGTASQTSHFVIFVGATMKTEQVSDEKFNFNPICLNCFIGNGDSATLTTLLFALSYYFYNLKNVI